MLYPNLKSLRCNFIQFDDLQKNIFDGSIKIRRLDYKLSLEHLHHINLNVVTMEDAKMFLSKLNHNKLETLCLYVMMPDLEPLDEIDCKYGYVKSTINEFVENICNYIEEHYKHLHSFSIDIDNKYAIHSCLEQTYWSLYNKYLTSILEMIKNGCIYDGSVN